MRRLLSAIAVLAAMLMIGVSTAMNFLFMKSLAATEIEGLVLGCASAAADILKSALPWFIALAFAGRRYLFSIVGTLVFLVFSLFSFASALGFAADIRGTLAGTREAATKELQQLEAEHERLSRQLDGLGRPRAVAIIEAEKRARQQDRRFSATKACTDATASASREFCTGYLLLDAEIASSAEAASLREALASIATSTTHLKSRGAGHDADPQVSVLARIVHLDHGVVRNALIIGAALLVELGSGLGLWLALGHSDAPQRARRTDTEARHPAIEQGQQVAAAVALPIAPPKDDITERTGEVVDFCVECLHPSDRGGLTLLALFRDYQSWCRALGLAPVAATSFETEFVMLAEEFGIARDHDRFVGVRTSLLLTVGAGMGVRIMISGGRLRLTRLHCTRLPVSDEPRPDKSDLLGLERGFAVDIAIGHGATPNS